MKSGFDPGPSVPKPSLFPLHACLSPLLSASLPLLPSLRFLGRPAPPLSSPPLPSPLSLLPYLSAAAEPRGGAGKPRPPSARAAAPAGQCYSALRRARCLRSPLRAPRQPPRGGRRAWRPAGRPDKGGAAEPARGRTDHGLRARAAGRSPEDPALPGPALGARPRRPGRPAGRTRSPRGAEEAAAAELEGRRGERRARPPEPWASAAGAARWSPSAACSW